MDSVDRDPRPQTEPHRRGSEPSYHHLPPSSSGPENPGSRSNASPPGRPRQPSDPTAIPYRPARAGTYPPPPAPLSSEPSYWMVSQSPPEQNQTQIQPQSQPQPQSQSHSAPAPPSYPPPNHNNINHHDDPYLPGPPKPTTINHHHATTNGLTHAPPIPIQDPPPHIYPTAPAGPPPPGATSAAPPMMTPAHPGPGPAPPILYHNHLPPVAQPATTAAAATAATLGEARYGAEAAVREYIALRRQRAMVNGVTLGGSGGGGVGLGVDVNGTGVGGTLGKEVEERVRVQAGVVLRGLEGLMGRVGEVERKGEGQRWRRWVVGGVFASIIPIVKALFRRPRDEDESSNKTEYAFKKSRNLVSRILASTHRPGLGTVAFFVFAVLYVFQNEVSLRMARTVSRRLKRLAAKIEEGREEVTEDDVKLLQGWRWRILMWSE